MSVSRTFGAEWKKARVGLQNRRILWADRHLLEPGLWVYSGWELWFRLGSRLPHHLRYAKGNLRGPLYYRALKALISPAYWFIVWPHTTERPRYHAAVRGPNVDRETILFSDDSVLRILRSPRDADQVRLRKIWDQYVTNSAVLEDQTTERFFVERLVPEGTTVNTSPLAQRTEAARIVARQYSRLVRENPMGQLRDHQENITIRLRRSSYQDLINAALERVGEERFWSLPLVPVGSDASPDNAIISPDGVAYFVDTEPIYLRPAFALPFTIWAAWDTPSGELLSAFLAGDGDTDLIPLFGETQPSPPLSPEDRMAWLILGILTPPVRPEVLRRRIRPADPLLDHYGITERAHAFLLGEASR